MDIDKKELVMAVAHAIYNSKAVQNILLGDKDDAGKLPSDPQLNANSIKKAASLGAMLAIEAGSKGDPKEGKRLFNVAGTTYRENFAVLREAGLDPLIFRIPETALTPPEKFKLKPKPKPKPKSKPSPKPRPDPKAKLKTKSTVPLESPIEVLIEGSSSHLAEYGNTAIILVTGNHCSACRPARTVFDQVAVKALMRNIPVKFCCLKVDDEPVLSRKLLSLRSLRTVPQIMVIKDGILVYNKPGVKNQKQLADIVLQATQLDTTKISDCIRERLDGEVVEWVVPAPDHYIEHYNRQWGDL